jgi:hypothetical protein
MPETLSTENHILFRELRELKNEISEACTMDASFKAREQLLRFENVWRRFSSVYDLDNRYQNAIFEMKLDLYRAQKMAEIQHQMLDHINDLSTDIKYISKM